MAVSFEEAVEAQRRELALPNTVRMLFHHWPSKDYPRICAIAAHTLRNDGSSVREWQPWLALAAWGCMVQENTMLARALALLARVYSDIAKCLPALISVSSRIDHHALAYVLGLLPTTERPTIPTVEQMTLVKDGLDSLGQKEYFGLLADAISRHDWELCQTSFEQLTELILEGRTAEPWDAELNPGYEPIPAAIAAAARTAGFPLDCLSDRTKDWLWPAVESQANILPVCWPFTTV